MIGSIFFNDMFIHRSHPMLHYTSHWSQARSGAMRGTFGQEPSNSLSGVHQASSIESQDGPGAQNGKCVDKDKDLKIWLIFSDNLAQ